MTLEAGASYVSVLPTAKGFFAGLRKQTDPAARAAGTSAGKQFGSTMSREGEVAGKGFAGGVKKGSSTALKAVGAVGLGLAGIGVGAVIAGKKAFGAFAGFDKTMRQVGVQTNSTGGEFTELNDLAIKLGKDTSFSAKQAADAMLELAKGGLNKAQIKAGALQSTLTLAAAGGLELGDAASYMVQGLNTFGLEASQAGEVAAALAGGANASVASVNDLGYALSQVGPGARNTGQSLQDTVGTLAAFANAGISGSDAGTSLKTMLDRLTPSTDKAKGAMEDLGINFVNADGSFKKLSEIAQVLKDKLKKLSPAQRSVALETMFGSDAQRAATVLMNEGSAGIEKYIAATKDQNAANALAKTNTEGAAGAYEQFSGSIDTFMIKAGQIVAPWITAGLKAGTGFINGFTDQLDGIGAGVKSAIGLVQKSVGSIAIGFSGGSAGGSGWYAELNNIGRVAREGFEAAKASLKDFGDAVLPALKTAGTNIFNEVKLWGTTAFGGIIDAFKTGDTKQIGKSIGDAIRTAFTTLADMAGTILKSLEKLFKSVDWVGLGITIGRQMIPFLLGLAAGILDLDWGTLWTGIVKHWPTLLMGALSIVLAPTKLLKPILAIVRKIPFVGPLIAWFIEAISKWGKAALKGIWNAIKLIGKGIGKGIGIALGLTGKGGAFFKALNAIPTGIGVFFINLIESIKGFFIGFGRMFVTGVENVAIGVGRIIGTILKPFFWLGKQVINIIKGMWKFVWDDTLKPGLAMLGKGWNAILDGIATFTYSVFRGIGVIISKIWKFIWTDTLKPGLKWLGDLWSLTIAYVKKSWDDGWKAIGDGINWVWTKVIQPVFNAIKTGVDLVKQGFELARDGIKSAWHAVANIARKPIEWVLTNIYTNGIKKTFDSIAAAVGLKITLPKAPTLPVFASGGKVRGPGTETSDSVLARLSKNEWVINAAARRKYGDGFLNAVNSGQLAAFAKGGPVAPVPGRHGGFPGYKGHTGVDYPVGIGTAVHNALEGVVRIVKHMKTSYGNHVRVTHGGGLETIYAHLSKTLVNAGQAVQTNQVIGKSGNTGNSTGPHLHFETRRAGKFFNPDDFLKGASSQGGVIDAIGDFIENSWKKVKNVGEWAKDKAQAAYDFVKSPGEILQKFVGGAIKPLIDKIPGSGMLTDIAKALPGWGVKKLQEGGAYLASKIKNVFSGDAAPTNSAQQIAAQLSKRYGWGADQFSALKELWQKESGWNYKARNPSSGAYGIPQAWPADKMSAAGKDWKTNPTTQIRWGLSYIDEAYGSPIKALSKWQARSPHWYANGTNHGASGWNVVGERGPELMKFKGGEQVKSNAELQRMNGQSNTYYIQANNTEAGKLVREIERRKNFRDKVSS